MVKYCSVIQHNAGMFFCQYIQIPNYIQLLPEQVEKTKAPGEKERIYGVWCRGYNPNEAYESVTGSGGTAMKQRMVESLRHAVGDLAQYREPLCFELAGKTFGVLMNSGVEYAFSFLSDKIASWCGRDYPVFESAYECLELKEKLYMIIFQPAGSASGLGMVIDLAAGLAVILLPGEDKPGLGTITTAGEGSGAALMEESCGMAGHSILWRCSPQDRFVQTFQNVRAFSISCAGSAGTVRTLNFSARYFQLREDIFLIATAGSKEGEAIMMLADMNAVRAMGMSRLAGPCGAGEPQCLLFCAYGAFIPEGGDVKAALFGGDERKYKTRIVGKAIVNPVTRRLVPAGLKQYVQPPSEELAGKALDMRLDGQKPVLIRFLDHAALEWAYQGGPCQPEAYECVKGDDKVYMIVCHPRLKKPASCVTLVWDMESHLITAILAWEHQDATCPRLIVSRAIFGAENREGEPLPALRHHYTDELIGKRIVWHYTANDDVLHICFDRTHFRLGSAKVTLSPNPSFEALANYQRLKSRQEKYPYYEEKVYYIKIREGFYLYSVIEYAMCRLLQNQGGGELLALVNTVRTRYVGRTFGLDAQENAGHDIVGAPGCFLSIPDEVESLACPIYDV
jgi:hypothetical protein